MKYKANKTHLVPLLLPPPLVVKAHIVFEADNELREAFDALRIPLCIRLTTHQSDRKMCECAREAVSWGAAKPPVGFEVGDDQRHVLLILLQIDALPEEVRMQLDRVIAGPTGEFGR